MASEQSTKQQSQPRVIVPASSQRDTLLGVGKPRARSGGSSEDTFRDKLPMFLEAEVSTPAVASVLFPFEQPFVGLDPEDANTRPVTVNELPQPAEVDLDDRDTLKVPALSEWDVDVDVDEDD